MDGNRRWAKQHGLPGPKGHREGLEALKRVVSAAERFGIQWLSLFVFSTENWKRTVDEVGCLMDLLVANLVSQMDFYVKRKLRLVHSGDLAGLPPKVQKEINDVCEATKNFDSMTVNLAINYGSRDELLRCFRRLESSRAGKTLLSPASGNAESSISCDELEACLDVPSMPDIDLLIRTGGEQRLSNFLLWKCAYAELYFSPRYWPDWDSLDLEKALDEYSLRQRRFGST